MARLLVEKSGKCVYVEVRGQGVEDRVEVFLICSFITL